MRTAAATVVLLISALCFMFDVAFIILVAVHAYREIQLGGWQMLPGVFRHIAWWRWMNAGVALAFGLTFLWSGFSLLPKRDEPK